MYAPLTKEHLGRPCKPGPTSHNIEQTFSSVYCEYRDGTGIKVIPSHFNKTVRMTASELDETVVPLVL